MPPFTPSGVSSGLLTPAGFSFDTIALPLFISTLAVVSVALLFFAFF